MSLPKKDVRFALNADTHNQMVALAKADRVGIAEFVERIVAATVRDRVQQALLIVSFVEEGAR